MKQILLKSWLTMLCLLVGVGTSWATEDTWTASSAGYANQAEVSNVTVNSNISLTFGAGTNSNAPKYYTSGTAVRAYGGNTITVKATNATITGLTFTFGSSDGSNAITANVGSFTSPNWSGSADEITFTIGGSTGNRRISAIKVTYTTSGGGTTPEPTKYTVIVANNIANGAVTANPTSAASGTEVTLTATPATGYEFGSWNVTNASTSAAITVTNNKFKMPAANVNVSATFNKAVVATLPFEFDGGVSDITSKDGMSQSGLGTDYSASPKLRFDDTNDNVVIHFNEAAKKITYTIKGNGTSGTYAFEVMESTDGVEYTTVHSHSSITDATSYTDNLKAESRFVKFVYTTKAIGNVALGKISIIAASVLEDPQLAFEQSTYTFFVNDDMQVVATSAAGSSGDITYALTAGDADAFDIDENTGEIVCYTAGTYTVTANVAEAAGFNRGTATCTVKIKEHVVGNSIIVAETSNGYYYAMATTCAGEYFGNKLIKKVGDKYVVESLDDILFCTNTAEGKTTIQSTSNAQYIQATAAKKISYTDDEYKWTNDGEKLTAANQSYGTLQYNTSNPRFTTYATKVGQYATIVDLANVVVGETATITLNAACTDGELVYGTYSNSKPWVVPADLIVSEIGIMDGKLNVKSYSTSDVVPANTGVMVSAEEGGDYAVEIETDPETLELAESVLGDENCLRPTGEGITSAEMEAANADCKFYYLTMNGDQIGYWWRVEDGGAFDMPVANRAYLAVPANQANLVKAGLWVKDDATLIDAIKNSKNTNGAMYNLNGQRVNVNAKGIVIVNGKKMLNK